MSELTRAMRLPRRPQSMSPVTGESWYYISPNSIQIFATDTRGKGANTTVTLTKRQLKQILKIMAGK